MPLNSLPPKELLGQILGGAYRIRSQIDEGGMGLVYEAEHVRLKRPVAVKVMAGHLAEDDNALARFTREAEIISQLHHPHVVQILDFNTTHDGRPYLVMELLRGRPLDVVMERHNQMGVGPAIRVALQAASALAAAHEVGIVHRDLKPANIFLVDTGKELFVKLLDFGISKKSGENAHSDGRKLTGEFDILGTPEYMAPEQALGHTAEVDARGDQYALAVILYEMLAGRVPFTADDVMDLLQRVIRDIPISPSVFRNDMPVAIDSVILRALAKAPQDRYSKITEFSQALEQAAAEGLQEFGAGLTGSMPPTAGKSSKHSPFAQGRILPEDGIRGNSVAALGGRSKRAENDSSPPPARSSSLPPPPVTSTRRSSWHDNDPVKAVQGLVDRARQELGLDNLEMAVSCAESALEIAQSSHSEEVNAIVTKNARLFQSTFERRLGKLTTTITVKSDASPSEALSPGQAFLLSRLEGGLSIEEAIDLSPVSREKTLGQIVSLMRLGHISLGAQVGS